jgi:hypothetical protein
VTKTRVETWEDATDYQRWRGSATSSDNPSNHQDTYSVWANGNQTLLMSLGHPYQKLGKTRADIGGAFSVVRRDYADASPYMHNRTTTNETNTFASNYLGKYYAQTGQVSDAQFPAVVTPLDSDLDALGTTAIANVGPTNPITGLAVTLGELKSEGIPSLVGVNTWKDRTFRAKQAGSEYLNVQFGWLPLVNEIRSLADTVRRSDEITRQYEAEEGRLVHRQYTFPGSTTTTTSTETGKYPVPAYVTGFWNSTGTKTTVTTTRVENWFSGAFTYMLPPRGSRAREVAIANKLYGTRLTPDVVWNLTPWSWAVDWFTNSGDVISNLSAFANDGLVMPYGYMMRRRTTTTTISLEGARAKRNNSSVNCWQRFTTTVKSRRKATPYGFGLDLTSLTGKQWTILSALGLSRGGNGMRYE